MAAFYLDHDVAQDLRNALQSLGHDVVTSQQLGQAAASDPQQLLTAARAGRILVTHNRKDYELLTDAWATWTMPFNHAGVLVIPQQRWTIAETAENIDRFIRSRQPLSDQLYACSPSRAWVKRSTPLSQAP